MPSVNVTGVLTVNGIATVGAAGSNISVIAKLLLSPSGSSSPSNASTLTNVPGSVTAVSSSATGGWFTVTVTFPTSVKPSSSSKV